MIMSFKQRKIKFKPMEKLNHNIYTMRSWLITHNVVIALMST